MKAIRKIVIYCFVICLALVSFSCDCNPENLVCPQMNQAEVDWIYLHDEKLILFTDTLGHKVTFGFDRISSRQEETDECKRRSGSCRCSCKSYVILNGVTVGYYENINIGVEITNRFNLEGKDSTFERSLVFAFDHYREGFYPTPFFKHNLSKLYPKKVIGKRTFSNVYEIKLAEQKDTARNNVFLPEFLYLTEKDGIVGFKNLVDSLVFYKQF